MPQSKATDLPSFQDLVDATPKGGLLTPPAGIYAGPVTIETPITIDGKNGVTIDAGGKGSVIYLDTDGATLQNLRLINSGGSHNDVDSGVQVKGDFNVVKDNSIEECLFGIDLSQSKNNIIRRNKISSKSDRALGLQGDSVRLWYSFDNQVTDNIITNSRDMVVWYSKDNTIARNRSSGGRYALHFMYSQGNLIEENEYTDNSVGIFLMYSDSAVIKNNYIAHSQGTTGMGIGLKETSDVKITGNKILYCATGIYSDVSPYQPDTINLMEDNLIAFNGIGMLFHTPWWGNVARNNSFKDNITQVAVDGNGGATKNVWEGNHWDDYEGFDQNSDGTGDTPYELYAYADRLWMDRPDARFFMGTPLLASLDFLEQLAPFSEPTLLLRDEKPLLASLDSRILNSENRVAETTAELNDLIEEATIEDEKQAKKDWSSSLRLLENSLQ
ncbi:MAG: nitrous oxide reductase family maturation protein NosD [Gammaproteobacteria bacterium]|uniref:Nitrous oxide reductase family maturation protein NosD n=1 Tax=Candidatus Thiopontia autotrophica TaxID=2841688 RepID=A0A8J6TSF2_9GAMM|nr:nitrous oxide reductase family maturation protein NosD [Candidatus Thiopontia autotrophica]MBL6969027.1 nitrous oxide reductase family maturation protein NosD [Gammaproteobacteria bacterium]